MESLTGCLTDIVSDAFGPVGLIGHMARSWSRSGLVWSDLGQFQCNGALELAQRHDMNARRVAEQVVDTLVSSPTLRDTSPTGPGFINLTATEEFTVRWLQQMAVMAEKAVRSRISGSARITQRGLFILAAGLRMCIFGQDG